MEKSIFQIKKKSILKLIGGEEFCDKYNNEPNSSKKEGLPQLDDFFSLVILERYIKDIASTGTWKFKNTHSKQLRIAFYTAVIEAAINNKISLDDIIKAAIDSDAPLDDIIEAAIRGNQEEEKVLNAVKTHKNDNHQSTLIPYLEVSLSGQRNLILQGPPGTGKTYCAKQIARCILKIGEQDLQDSEYFKLVQFHPSTCYEDFVRGIKAVTSDDGTVSYRAENGVLGALCDQALEKPEEEFVLIIDEINRANLPAVLGECIYALEYRGEPVDTPYAVKSEGLREAKQFIIPDNLTIIGTMNTADRSAGYIDYAIRRRFAFIPVLPDVSVIPENNNENFNDVQALFDNHLSPDFHKDDVAIGHSYFLKRGEAHTASMQYAVAPLLEEYLKDGIFDENSRNEVDGVIENLKTITNK